MRNIFLKYSALYLITFILSLWIGFVNYPIRVDVAFWLRELSFAISLILISYTGSALHRDLTLKLLPTLGLLLAICFAGILNTQAAFVVIFIFATTFLITCPPFILNRFSVFIPLQICLNCAGIIFVSLVTIRNFIGIFPFALFLICFSGYLLASLIYRLFLPYSGGVKILYIIGIYILINIFLGLSFMYFSSIYLVTH